jgi:hypothetical protein
MTQIFSNDPVVPYKTTKINPLTTKAEIEGLLARWNIKKYAWNWDPENSDITLNFQVTEIIEEKEVNVVVQLECPHIYDKPSRRNPKLQINWQVSMRVLYWWLKPHLEYHYLSQSTKLAMFLPFIQGSNGKTLEKTLVPRLSQIAQGQLVDKATIEPDSEMALKEYELLKKEKEAQPSREKEGEEP